ncbi:MAG: hypothetical protein U9O85_06655 [Euryarchaeota archaeon]|nr:hypothetical protein [Euryarchaeota archaeon]
MERKRKDYEIEEEFRTFEEYETALHALMDVVGMSVHITESMVGRSSRAFYYRLNKDYGAKIGKMAGKKKNVEEAIESLRRCQDWWDIQLWSKSGESLIDESEDDIKFKIVIRDCIIRQTLLRENLPQRSMMCYLTNGFIMGALETMLDMKGDIEVIHAGNNACLKEITLTDIAGGK